MFRLLKVKPPHGWNAVAWELGIVTVGVLIALAAQQFVDDLHWRGELRDFRTAVRAEISWDLATYTYCGGQNRCAAVRSRASALARQLACGAATQAHRADRTADRARRSDQRLGQPRSGDILAHAAVRKAGL